jgi:hypothetical protein
MTKDDINAIFRQAKRADEEDRLVKLDPKDCMTICNLANRMLEFDEKYKDSRGDW